MRLFENVAHLPDGSADLSWVGVQTPQQAVRIAKQIKAGISAQQVQHVREAVAVPLEKILRVLHGTSSRLGVEDLVHILFPGTKGQPFRLSENLVPSSAAGRRRPAAWAQRRITLLPDAMLGGDP
ncbi:hypothetical protein LCGC14_1587310 [marine sediment metagenome]|uniref:Uncharacterized protein n=1 Tax=marine sediment metagenome TaxID=412755 RepID=A0A0F9J172_9ZZZZ